jgi:hypothetical protein
MSAWRLDSVDAVERALAEARYLPDRGLATAVYLSLAIERPHNLASLQEVSDTFKSV